jgi:hypothetical protein
MVIDCKQVCAERYTMNLAGGTLLNAYICVYVAAASFADRLQRCPLYKLLRLTNCAEV